MSAPARPLRSLALGAVGTALAALALQQAVAGHTRLHRLAGEAAERRLAATVSALAGAVAGSRALQTSPAEVLREAGRGATLAEVRLGRPGEEDGTWDVGSAPGGGNWHPPLADRLVEPTHAAAWGSAVVGEIGLAGPPDARWAYARSSGPAASWLVGVQAPAEDGTGPARAPWLGLLILGVASMLGGAWLAGTRLAALAGTLEALRRGGLEAARGRRVPVPPEAPEALLRAASQLGEDLATALVAGEADDQRLEAHRRRSELVRALSWPAPGGEDATARDAGGPRWGAAETDASGWLQHERASVAWWRQDPEDALEATLRRAAVGALAARALAEGRGGAPGQALQALVGAEIDALAWQVPGEALVHLLGSRPRPGLLRASSGTWRRVELPAEGTWGLAPGETLVLAGGSLAALEEAVASPEALPATASAPALAGWLARTSRSGEGPGPGLITAWRAEPEAP